MRHTYATSSQAFRCSGTRHAARFGGIKRDGMQRHSWCEFGSSAVFRSKLPAFFITSICYTYIIFQLYRTNFNPNFQLWREVNGPFSHDNHRLQRMDTVTPAPIAIRAAPSNFVIDMSEGFRSLLAEPRANRTTGRHLEIISFCINFSGNVKFNIVLTYFFKKTKFYSKNNVIS